MRRWILPAAIVMILFYGDIRPFESMDAGELCVAETLFVEQQKGKVHLVFKDAEGEGADFDEAYVEMKDNAPGKLFLRQVKRVIFCGGAENGVDVLNIPRQIPLGAAVYTAPGKASQLVLEIADLEKRLEVQERESKQMPTLAQLKNKRLEQEKLSGEDQ